jgi:hypothetical protein
MSQDTEELPRPVWHDFLELLTKEREGDDVTVEVLTAEYGDQYAAEKLPFSYVEDGADDSQTLITFHHHPALPG